MQHSDNLIAGGAQHAESAASMVAKSAPAAPGMLVLAGHDINVWVAILSAVWLLMLMSGWMWDRFVAPRRKVRRDSRR